MPDQTMKTTVLIIKTEKIIKKRELKRKLRAYARSQPDH
jgi:hypothetical protein